MQDEPTPEELTKAVADFLRNDIAPQISGHNAFKLRVAINMLDLVTRQLRLGQGSAHSANSIARSPIKSQKARPTCKRPGSPIISGRPPWTSSPSISRIMRRIDGSWRTKVANPSLRGAKATKQSTTCADGDDGLLRFARNDGEGALHPLPYFPSHFGGRFSENAFGPSM
jgi:hypothetical protein